MKNFAAILLLVILISGCTRSTEFWPCIGIGDDKNPSLVYKVSANNLFWAIMGVELIAPPLFVVIDQFYCPVTKKSN